MKINFWVLNLVLVFREFVSENGGARLVVFMFGIFVLFNLFVSEFGVLFFICMEVLYCVDMDC